MFYRRRIEEIFEKSSKKNKEQDIQTADDFENDLNQYKNRVDLEPGDLLGMIIGGYYAFLPIFIVLFIILFLTRPPW